MALVVLASACGSPGVTTTALALTMVWPRPVLLVEADPTGSSAVFAGFFRGEQEPRGGLIDLALALREDILSQALPEQALVLDPAAPPERSAWFLPGIRSHEQATSLLPLWEPLAEVLHGLDAHGQDVLVDAGRLGLTGSPLPLIASSDLTLLVTRSSLPGLAGARSWAASLRAQFASVGGLSRLGSVVVDESGRWPVASSIVPRVRPYSARQIAKALDVPALACLPWEPEVAEVFSHGARRPRKFETSTLLRAYRAAAESIAATLAANQTALAQGMEAI